MLIIPHLRFPSDFPRQKDLKTLIPNAPLHTIPFKVSCQKEKRRLVQVKNQISLKIKQKHQVVHNIIQILTMNLSNRKGLRLACHDKNQKIDPISFHKYTSIPDQQT